MGRGRGKGKRGGGRGGGGKLFVANVEELQMRENQVNEAAKRRQERRGDSDEDDDEDNSDVEQQPIGEDTQAQLDKLREMKLEAKKEAEEEEEDEDRKPSGLLGLMETANPNAGKQNKMLKTKDLKNMGDIDVEQTLSRREREALEAAKKKADYERRHAAGETEQAKTDMARLAEVRRRREEAQKKCEADGRKPGWTENGIESDDDNDDSDEDGTGLKARSAKAAAVLADPESVASRKKAAAMAPAEEEAPGDAPKLSSIEIKKMKPDAIKEALKARGLSTQGQKKDLMKRLCDYEATRE